MKQQEIFFIQEKCFNLSGFRNVKKFQSILKCLQTSYIFVLFYCVFSESVSVLQSFDNVLVAAETFGPIATGLIAVSNILSFAFSMEKFFSLMGKLKVLAKNGV